MATGSGGGPACTGNAARPLKAPLGAVHVYRTETLAEPRGGAMRAGRIE